MEAQKEWQDSLQPWVDRKVRQCDRQTETVYLQSSLGRATPAPRSLPRSAALPEKGKFWDDGQRKAKRTA